MSDDDNRNYESIAREMAGDIIDQEGCPINVINPNDYPCNGCKREYKTMIECWLKFYER